MININEIINKEIIKERTIAKYQLSQEILEIIMDNELNNKNCDDKSCDVINYIKEVQSECREILSKIRLMQI